MTYAASDRVPPKGALALLVVVALLVLLQVGALVQRVFADIGGGTPSTTVAPDPISDKVAATAAEFRVDESGAATYSIPLYAVPGTAGVVPQLALKYSSQGGYGPLGKGWAVAGTSSIARCRATHESGDFIAGGVSTPVNFTATDRFCLDGQRLLPAPAGSAACRAVGGMTSQNLRTELESFQRVCAYTPSGGTSGPAFFTVERKDGSISWYGDRDNDASATRPDGYVNSTAPGKTAFAIAWAQTRFRDSTGNYIDYVYLEDPAGAGTGEHLLSEVRYTGKVVLPTQSGSASAPYAKLMFTYGARPAANWVTGYSAGGLATQSRRLDSVTVCASAAAGCATTNQARFYALTYATSVSGSGADTLTSFQECRDSGKAVCLPPTTFTWSDAKNELPNGISWNPGYFGSVLKFEGMKLGDVDGDGRQDLVWLKDGSTGETCPTEHVMVSFGEIDASSRQTFSAPVLAACTPTEIMSGMGDGSWQLFDYTGDGREDLFVAGASTWFLYASAGRTADPFGSTNLLATIPIPTAPTGGMHPQLTDLNGDGQMDVVYNNSGLRIRLMERNGANFNWGVERTASFAAEPAEVCPDYADPGSCNQNGPHLWNPDIFRLADFNGDAASDLLFNINLRWTETTECGPGEFPPRDCGQQHAASYLTYAYGVSAVTATTVQFKRISGQILGDRDENRKPLLADLNGDGLTDLVYAKHMSTMWRYALNTGAGFLPSADLADLPWPELVKIVDANGDGRSDVAFANPQTDGTYRYFVRRWTPSGTFTLETFAGNGAFPCLGACDPRSAMHLFSDLDADGGLDYFTITIDDLPVFYLSQPGSASRGKPRDTIVSIMNGLGAITEVTYATLANAGVHRRDTGSRAANWGRGSPVQDIIAPSYVVSSASSSAPTATNANAMATLYYRYAGAKAQAGGRGYLGFREVSTIDPNHAGGHVVTTTTYSQNFPFVGLPAQTVKKVVTGGYAPSSCQLGAISNACYATPGQAFPGFSGSWFSDNTQVWEGDTESASTAIVPFSATVQAPIHARTAGSDEKLRDPFTLTQTSRVATAFSYGAHSNVVATTVDTYTGQSTLVSTVLTSNVYTDNTGQWHLGRLTSSTVTHRRPGKTDVVRTAAFAYDATTGQLTAERSQSFGPADQELRKEYTLDQYGNRTMAETCAAPATSCSPTIAFHPVSPLAIQRYSRSVYDSLGRYPLATYEPVWGGTGAVEVKTQTVVSRNLFGDVTQAYDVNGVDVVSVPGTMGRGYYTWAETVPGSVPGASADGVESFTTYRWCGSGTNFVSCPANATFRKKTVTEGAPAGWEYFDLLGRPVLKVVETFNAGVSAKDLSAVCTGYEATGKPERVSNPFFLAGVSGGIDTAALSAVCTDAARKWTVTTYDVLGRPEGVASPDGTMVLTDIVGLDTTVIDQRGNTTKQTRNGKGELVSVTDDNGLVMSYAYQADGSISSISRDAGRGAIVNSFVYDAMGRKVQQNDPDSGLTTFEYNALGELVAQTDAAGNRIENEIDGRGRVWRRTVKLPNGTIESQSTFEFDTAYNGIGKPASEAITGLYAGYTGQTGLDLDFSRSYTYDTLGRANGSATVIDGATYSTAVLYDALGRAWKAQDASGKWAKTAYNTRGMVAGVCESSAGDAVASCALDANLYVRPLEADEWGHTTKDRRGNLAAMDVTRGYWADTGRIASICAGSQTTCNLQDEEYAWDGAGNLHSRAKDGQYLEGYTYDNLNRLLEAKLLIVDGVTANTVTQAWKYDALGNICEKTEWGGTYAYDYLGRAGCGTAGLPGSGGLSPVSPHQVAQIGITYMSYDVRGNMTDKTRSDAPDTVRDRHVRYSADNRGYEIALGNQNAPIERTRFWYGSDGARYKREDAGKRTLYLGNVEIVTEASVTTIKRTVAGVLLQKIVGASVTNEYLFHDHLGSLTRIASASGQATASLDYNAFGMRRNYNLQTMQGTAPTQTNRGFTGHEQLDNAYVVHMNGRLFSMEIGRFMQPDPVIQAPDNAQSWNAYTYVFNNPLAYTDPTGMIGVKERQWAGVIITVVAAIFAPYIAPQFQFLYAVGTGAAAGGASTGSWQGAMYGAFSAAVFYGVGSYFKNAEWAQATATNNAFGSGMTWGGYGAKVLAHGAAGGVMAKLQGGRFGDGFAAAGVAQAAAPGIESIGSAPGRIVAAAIVGGTVSELTGGKFANGAVTAAFSRTFNGELHRERLFRYQQLEESNFVPYFTDGQEYLAAPAVNGLLKAEWQWSFDGETAKIGIGDMSLSDGSSRRPHSTHVNGLNVDIRPIRLDGSGGPTNWRNSTYDRAATQRLVNTLRATGNVELIYFNDPQITGVTFCCRNNPTLHDHHLHVKYKP